MFANAKFNNGPRVNHMESIVDYAETERSPLQFTTTRSLQERVQEAVGAGSQDEELFERLAATKKERDLAQRERDEALHAKEDAEQRLVPLQAKLNETLRQFSELRGERKELTETLENERRQAAQLQAHVLELEELLQASRKQMDSTADFAAGGVDHVAKGSRNRQPSIAFSEASTLHTELAGALASDSECDSTVSQSQDGTPSVAPSSRQEGADFFGLPVGTSTGGKNPKQRSRKELEDALAKRDLQVRKLRKRLKALAPPKKQEEEKPSSWVGVLDGVLGHLREAMPMESSAARQPSAAKRSSSSRQPSAARDNAARETSPSTRTPFTGEIVRELSNSLISAEDRNTRVRGRFQARRERSRFQQVATAAVAMTAMTTMTSTVSQSRTPRSPAHSPRRSAPTSKGTVAGAP